MKEFVRYALAVAGYIVLAMFTKRYLTWTWGPIYFVVVLEVLPRTVRLLQRTLGRLLTGVRGRPVTVRSER